jgi:hypothetical protein
VKGQERGDASLQIVRASHLSFDQRAKGHGIYQMFQQFQSGLVFPQSMLRALPGMERKMSM